MAKYSNGLEDRLDIPESSVKVLERRYLKVDEAGRVLETGEDMLRRVAKDIAAADAFYMPEFKGKVYVGMPTQDLYKVIDGNPQIKQREEEFFNMMLNRYFLPNSPTLMNAGRELQQLSACFVLPIEDDLKSIYETLKNAALIHQSGGGTGFSFSRLRPKGDVVKSTMGVASGPVSFMKVYDVSTEEVKQGGTRRGANMGILRVDHPDIMEFITCKDEEGKIKNFNISVAITDDFMRAVKEDKEYNIINPRTGNVTGSLRAREVFDKIVEQAWKNGEPGIIFIDRINQYNPTPEIGMIESTNPCGEQPLLPYESCNLGSINLAEMVSEDGKLNESLLEKTVRSAVRFLDNVIDRNKYVLKEIEEMTKANRKIGLGVMGFAHMLIRMGIGYNEGKAIEMAEKVMKFINDVSKDESKKLAIERGPFPNFDKSIYKDKALIRNATTTTIAPTGSIGTIANTSTGIEPIFSVISERNVKDTLGENLLEIDREFERYLKKHGLHEKNLLMKMAKEGLDVEDLGIPSSVKEEIKRLFVTAHDVSPEHHIKIQAAFQKYIDNAVSKTINMPNSATKEDVAKSYFLAYDLGCKGLTIYRDGSRQIQVLTKAGSKKNLEGKLSAEELTELDDAIKEAILNGKRPDSLIGVIYKQKTPHGNVYVSLNAIDGNPNFIYESFSQIGKAGEDLTAMAEALGRITSIAIQRGLKGGMKGDDNIMEIVHQLKGIGGANQVGFGNDKVLSLPDGIGKALEKGFYKLKSFYSGLKGDKMNLNPTSNPGTIEKSGNFCPDCGSILIMAEGCEKCTSPGCGFSRC